MDGQNVLYQDFLASYMWKQKEKRWQLQQQQTAVGRVYHYSLLAGEKYYLRMLLTVVPDLQSYKDLRIVDGQLFLTFQAACCARGLLKDDQEWIRCFTKAASFSTRHSLWTLFEVALVHGQVTNGQLL